MKIGERDCGNIEHYIDDDAEGSRRVPLESVGLHGPHLLVAEEVVDDDEAGLLAHGLYCTVLHCTVQYSTVLHCT